MRARQKTRVQIFAERAALRSFRKRSRGKLPKAIREKKHSHKKRTKSAVNFQANVNLITYNDQKKLDMYCLLNVYLLIIIIIFQH